MKLMFWKASKPRVMTRAINQHLISEFALGPELLANLSVLEKNGKFSNRKVRMVRVYDPELVSTDGASELKYDDLKGTENERAIRFEGHVEKDGSLYFRDRRPKAGTPGADSR